MTNKENKKDIYYLQLEDYEVSFLTMLLQVLKDDAKENNNWQVPMAESILEKLNKINKERSNEVLEDIIYLIRKEMGRNYD